jgi:AcrR family transcriptional regulator
MPRKSSRPVKEVSEPEAPPPVVSGRQLLGQQTRERLLDAAARLVLRTSVSAMSISELVRLAGVPASSIYWHFGSKEGLVAAMAAAAVERWLAGLPDPQTLPATGEARVLAGIIGVTDALAKDSRVVALVTKVGVELGAGQHEALEVVRRARAEVLDYGVKLFAPAFSEFPAAEAQATGRRMAALLMATADGIAVDAATHGRGAVVAEEYRVLAELAVLLYRHSISEGARRPGSARARKRAA